MFISAVKVYRITLPFLFNFSHALRKRSSVNNIIVEVVAEQGKNNGYGEGAPRSYVTGESQESMVESILNLIQHGNFPWQLNDVAQIWDFVDALSGEKMHNAAVCALETALLDALGKSQNRYILDYFPKNFLTGEIHYGASIPLADPKSVTALCRLCQQMKVKTLRLKLGKDFEQNKAIVETVHSVFGQDCDQRADINCAWDGKLAFKHIPLIKKYKIRVVEQPMVPDAPELAEFAAEMRTCGVVLMADESACTFSDVEKILKEGHYEMINVRLSKCGGFRRSMEIVDYLRSKGVSFQIGCQLGESGILSAAGRALCLLCGDALYFDGSYDHYLLKQNITCENITFGPGGKAGPLTGPGLGVEVSAPNLVGLSKDSAEVIIKNPDLN